MRLTYIGHATFLAESDAGLRVLVDPFQPAAFGKFDLRPFRERVDVVVSTHRHLDHYWIDEAFGEPAVVTATGAARGVDFQGFDLPHDDREGAVRGRVTGFRFALDGVVLFHPGDLGRPPTPAEVAAIGPVDVLLLPTGGTFTIGPRDAVETMRRLAPAFCVPMHYRNARVRLDLLPVSDFLDLAGPFETAATQPVTFDRRRLPPPTTVLLMPPQH